MDFRTRFEQNPGICGGKTVIKGTRIPVQIIMNCLAAGQTVEEVLEEYPTLERDDVYAVIRFAATSAAEDEVSPLPAAEE